MDVSPKLDLPYLQPNQAQKHVTMNEALRRLDAIVQLSVLSATVGVQPTEPGNGDRYVLPAGATGTDWSGLAEGSLVAFQDGAWLVYAPQPGWRTYVEDTGEHLVWRDDGWKQLLKLGVNAVPDEINRLAVGAQAVLMSHEPGSGLPGDIRLKLNRKTSGDTATCLFQTSWSGRAELGLAGDNHFRLKTSSDGAAWMDALTVDTASAHIGLGTDAAEERLEVGGAIRSHSDAGSAHFANANDSTSLAPGESIDIPDFSGLVMVVDTLTGAVAQYLCGGGVTVLVANVVSVPGALAFDTGPNRYVFTNTTPAAGLYRFLMLRVRDAA